MSIDFYKTTAIPCRTDSPLCGISCLFLDVDGTLTDGGVYYDENGNELKKFSVKDGAGFITAKACGIRIIVLTARSCKATEKRMQEFGVQLSQNVLDKPAWIRQYMHENGLQKSQTAYIGDDLIDYAAMQLTGFVGCPADAADEIRAIADYVSSRRGGDGAFRDTVSYLLKQRGQWDAAIAGCYHFNSFDETGETI